MNEQIQRPLYCDEEEYKHGARTPTYQHYEKFGVAGCPNILVVDMYDERGDWFHELFLDTPKPAKDMLRCFSPILRRCQDRAVRVTLVGAPLTRLIDITNLYAHIPAHIEWLSDHCSDEQSWSIDLVSNSNNITVNYLITDSSLAVMFKLTFCSNANRC